MPGLGPGIHVFPPSRFAKTWMAGTSPAMTDRWWRFDSGSDAMNIRSNSRYHEVHARSLRDPEGFWADAAREIDWIEPAKRIFDSTTPPYRPCITREVVTTCINPPDSP